VPEAAEIDPLVLELDNRRDLGKPVNAADERVFDDIAKALGKGEKPLRRQCLLAKEDHQVIEPSPADRCDGGGIEIFRKIDPGYLGPDCSGNRSYLERIAFHRVRNFFTGSTGRQFPCR
jgi:hypothetical protein